MGRGKDKTKRRMWSASEDEYLRRNFPDHPTGNVARALGRSAMSVSGQAQKLGLKKSEAYLATPAACRLRRGDDVGKDFRFKPGQIPANKGMRRPGYAPGRMRETQFVKGQKPRNTLPVGTVRANADGYPRIKISDAPETPDGKGANSRNWEFVHKRVWEAARGPIPKGHRIWWRDGNHFNCALENLELVSGKEHMARTTIHTLPPELKETIRLTASLGRAIRKRAKSDGKESTGRPAESSVRDARTAKG